MKLTRTHTRALRLSMVLMGAAAAATVLATVAVSSEAAASQIAGAKISGGVLRVTGTSKDDQLTFRLDARDASVLEIDAGDDGTADFRFDRAGFTAISVKAHGGNDLIRVDEANGQITEPSSFRGGPGDDTILGGSAIETIYGGPGDDFIDGNRASDVAFMGPGKDTFRWDPGDASDVVEGEDGRDTLLFNGAGAAETVELSANGERFTFFRNPGTITMDVNGVETSVFNALGGPDTISVGDLTGTDVLNVHLALDGGQPSGDGQADQVTVSGTAGTDSIAVAGDADNVSVTGLTAAVDIGTPEFANDRLDINTGSGNDTVDASGLAAGAIQLFVDGTQIN